MTLYGVSSWNYVVRRTQIKEREFYDENFCVYCIWALNNSHCLRAHDTRRLGSPSRRRQETASRYQTLAHIVGRAIRDCVESLRASAGRQRANMISDLAIDCPPRLSQTRKLQTLHQFNQSHFSPISLRFRRPRHHHRLHPKNQHGIASASFITAPAELDRILVLKLKIKMALRLKIRL